MKTKILIVLMILTVRVSDAQDKWCFVTAVVSQEKTTAVQQLFISDVVELSTLNCLDSLSAGVSGKKKELQLEQYEQCVRDWFYQKVARVQNNTKSFSKDGIKVVFRRPEMNCPKEDFKCYFLTKKEATKIREICISIAKENGEQVFEIQN